MALQRERDELRRHFLGIRQRISHENGQAQQALCAQLLVWLEKQQVTSVGRYWPIRAEPDLRVMISEWLSRDQNRRAALPVVDSVADGVMHYSQWRAGVSMGLGCYGIAVPQQDVPIIPEVILSPCVAFNRAGYRLGNGGGFFDRYLKRYQSEKLATVAVGYDDLESVEFVPEAHDVAFDFIATETGVWESAK